MKLRTLGVFLVLLWTFAAFGTGCRPYHHGEVGVEVDIHSKDRGDQHDNGLHKGQLKHDDDHHDRDDNHDDNR